MNGPCGVRRCARRRCRGHRIGDADPRSGEPWSRRAACERTDLPVGEFLISSRYACVERPLPFPRQAAGNNSKVGNSSQAHPQLACSITCKFRLDQRDLSGYLPQTLAHFCLRCGGGVAADLLLQVHRLHGHECVLRHCNDKIQHKPAGTASRLCAIAKESLPLRQHHAMAQTIPCDAESACVNRGGESERRNSRPIGRAGVRSSPCRACGYCRGAPRTRL